MKFFKSDQNSTSDISILNDPFKSEMVAGVSIFIRRDIFNRETFNYSANVAFKNNNTSGEQRIEARDFKSLMKNVEAFLESLN